jgi:hypothetical protein
MVLFVLHILTKARLGSRTGGAMSYFEPMESGRKIDVFLGLVLRAYGR